MGEFLSIPAAIINRQAAAEITKCNSTTARYGLVLSQAQAAELVQTRTEALISTGRVEFGGGIIDKLILEFCDSPYITQSNFSQTINELIETFYYFKNEALDNISDDELILQMKTYFDTSCQGSIELLQNRELENMARNIRYGKQDYTVFDDSDDEDDFFEDENEDDEKEFYNGFWFDVYDE